MQTLKLELKSAKQYISLVMVYAHMTVVIHGYLVFLDIFLPLKFPFSLVSHDTALKFSVFEVTESRKAHSF